MCVQIHELYFQVLLFTFIPLQKVTLLHTKYTHLIFALSGLERLVKIPHWCLSPFHLIMLLTKSFTLLTFKHTSPSKRQPLAKHSRFCEHISKGCAPQVTHERIGKESKGDLNWNRQQGMGDTWGAAEWNEYRELEGMAKWEKVSSKKRNCRRPKSLCRLHMHKAH